MLAAVAVLLYLGTELERLSGAIHLVAIYVLAGLAGSAAFVLAATVTGFDGTALGASAAFLGVLGALAAAPATPRSERPDLPKLLAAIVLVNAAAPLVGIAAWDSSIAHLAGMAVGATYVLVLRRRAPGTLSPGSSPPVRAGHR